MFGSVITFAFVRPLMHEMRRIPRDGGYPNGAALRSWQAIVPATYPEEVKF